MPKCLIYHKNAFYAALLIKLTNLCRKLIKRLSAPDCQYLVSFSDNPSFPPRCILLLVAVRLVALINVKVTVHLILCVWMFSMILVIPRFLKEKKQKGYNLASNIMNNCYVTFQAHYRASVTIRSVFGRQNNNTLSTRTYTLKDLH